MCASFGERFRREASTGRAGETSAKKVEEFLEYTATSQFLMAIFYWGVACHRAFPRRKAYGHGRIDWLRRPV